MTITALADTTDTLDVRYPDFCPITPLRSRSDAERQVRSARPAPPRQRPNAATGRVVRPALDTRRRTTDVMAWSLRTNRFVDPQALGAIMLAEADRWRWELDCWTEYGLWEFGWSRVASSCVLRGEAVPTDIAETLWTYLEWLIATHGLADGSDPMPVLRSQLRAFGDLGPDGRRLNRSVPTPAAADVAEVIQLRPDAPQLPLAA